MYSVQDKEQEKEFYRIKEQEKELYTVQDKRKKELYSVKIKE